MKETAQLDLRKITTLLSLLREMVKLSVISQETLILFLSRFGDVSVTFTGVLEVRVSEGQ